MARALLSLGLLLCGRGCAAASDGLPCGGSGAPCGDTGEIQPMAEGPLDDACFATQVMVQVRKDHHSPQAPAENDQHLQVHSPRLELEHAGSDGEDLHVGTFVQVLPGSKLIGTHGATHCAAGDRGRVSGLVSSKSALHALVTWERTGQTSKVPLRAWWTALRAIGKPPALLEGSWLQALPGHSLLDDDAAAAASGAPKEVYKPGDFGVIVEMHTLPKQGRTNKPTPAMAMASILWTRSQRISTVSTHAWPKHFRYAKQDDTNNTTSARMQTEAALQAGALVQAKRVKVWAQCGDYCGREFFRMGDLGRLSGRMGRPARILVTWQHTGNTSSLPLKYWQRFIRIISRAPAVKAGDWLQALPQNPQNNGESHRPAQAYMPGDFGLVVEVKKPSNATPSVVISWSHSKRNTTTTSLAWPKSFRLAMPGAAPVET